jgi:hypothetical protein
MMRMAHPKPPVPDPLIENLPKFLSWRVPTTPVITELFRILIAQDFFKAASTIVDTQEIRTAQPTLRMSRDE